MKKRILGLCRRDKEKERKLCVNGSKSVAI